MGREFAYFIQRTHLNIRTGKDSGLRNDYLTTQKDIPNFYPVKKLDLWDGFRSGGCDSV